MNNNLIEVQNISAQSKSLLRSKSIAITDEYVASLDTIISPLSPKLDNYSVQQDLKKKISHLKKFSLTSSYSNLHPLKKCMTPDAKMMSQQRSFAQLPFKTETCKNLLSQFNSLKDQKENNVSKTEACEPVKLPKERVETAAPTLTRMRS